MTIYIYIYICVYCIIIFIINKDNTKSPQSTWSHWLFGYLQLGSNGVTSRFTSLYIPKLISTDAGTLYCVYALGSNTSPLESTAYSAGLTISLSTKSSSSSSSSRYRNRLVDYSALLLAASSKIFII